MMTWMCSFIFLLLGRIETGKADCSCNKNYKFSFKVEPLSSSSPTAEPIAHSVIQSTRCYMKQLLCTLACRPIWMVLNGTALLRNTYILLLVGF